MKTESQPTLSRHELLGILRRNRALLFRFRVKRIGLFGSYATGRQTKGSDLDFLVEFEQSTFDNFMGLHDFLRRLFRRKIDLLTPAGVASIRIKSVAENIKKTVVYA